MCEQMDYKTKDEYHRERESQEQRICTNNGREANIQK